MKAFKYGSIFLLIAGLFAAYYCYTLLFGSIILKETTLYVYPETTYTELLNSLEDKELIQHNTLFQTLAERMNLPNNIHAGKYVFETGASTYDVIAKIRGGLQTPVKLVINNVNFKEDLAGKISNQMAIDSSALVDFLGDEEKLKALGYNKDDILCLFIPNTYEVYWNMNFEAFIEKLEKEHDAFWTESRLDKATALGLTPKKAFILASIVEKEYKHPEERIRIAGVYLNRINLGMKLQADPTVKFALGDLSLKRVLTVHTEYDHPYNTYYNLGLPPGPICLPETSTIDAVLNAEDHDYIYFCAKEDFSGYHVFNTTYNAHLQSAKLYQAALNKLKIYE